MTSENGTSRSNSTTRRFVGITLRLSAWLVAVLVIPLFVIPYAFDSFSDFGVSVSDSPVRAVSRFITEFLFITVPLLVCVYAGFEAVVANLSEGQAKTAKRIYWIVLLLLVTVTVLSMAGPLVALVRAMAGS